ncbi:MAG: hypothetical protein ACFE9Q_12340 [Candidatus Hodarchaeota archaeon]
MSEIDSHPIRKVSIKTILIIIFSVTGLAAIIITLAILFSNSGTNGGGG